ncbi:MAG: DUF1127 domain-containing protein [Alphaproteobacteria bacterium]|nr:DUF1127 domain-containing protein [Alphaproteobacteria bacterium]
MTPLPEDRIPERINYYAIEQMARLHRSAAMAEILVALFVGAERGARRLAAAFRRWMEIQDTIADLERLDDRCLADIGIEREGIAAFATGHQARHDAEGHLYVVGSAPIAANAQRAAGVAA